MQPADIRKHLDAQPQGRATLLGELRRAPDAVSVLQGTRLPTEAPTPSRTTCSSTTTLLLLRGKALSVSAFTVLREDGGRRTGCAPRPTRWVDDLLRLNAR